MSTPYRRVVPAGYHIAELTLVGTAALLMNSGDVDRDSEAYRAYDSLKRKARKSLDDEARLRELEWAFGLYHDKDLGPYVPGKNIHEMIRKAATKWRVGEDIKRSLLVVENRIPLIYDGPRDQQGLWDADYRYTTMVANAGMNRGRVVRCRPCFDEWSLATQIAWDPEDVDSDQLVQIVERTQKYGLGDYRPVFGAFEASLGRPEAYKANSNHNASKPRDARRERAHKAAKERLGVS